MIDWMRVVHFRRACVRGIVRTGEGLSTFRGAWVFCIVIRNSFGGSQGNSFSRGQREILARRRGAGWLSVFKPGVDDGN